VKKKALTLAICMAFATPTISIAKSFPVNMEAVSLGEIQSDSHLNEPFNAIIPIRLKNIEDTRYLTIKLAPDAVFDEMGAEKLPILKQLTFRIGARNYQPVTLVSSTQPIKLPFINFVLEVKGPEGTIYQDFTALLDPLESDVVKDLTTDTSNEHIFNANKITENQSPHLDTPRPVSNIEPSLLDVENELKKLQSSLLLATNSSPKLKTKIQNSYIVKSGDTLSQIAERLNTSNVSLKRMTQAIYLNNPAAFNNNNINKLKKGAVLRIPTLKEIKNLSVVSAKNNDTGKKHETKNQHKLQQTTYTVKKGDTLSSIIRTMGYTGISFTKTLKALHSENPNAFSRNNINKLITGAVLTLPSFEKLSVSHKKQPTRQEELSDSKEYAPKVYTVKKGDTLSQVVKKIGYKNVSFTKMMKAIYTANPHAFLKSNITILKEGAIIQVPPLEEVVGITAVNAEEKASHPTINNNKTSANELSHGEENPAVVYKLEKRLRELRRKLTKTKSSLLALEASMHNKESLIDQKTKDLEELKNTINQTKTEVISDHKQTNGIQTPSADATIDEGLVGAKTKQAVTLEASMPPDLKQNGYIPENLNAKIKNAALSHIKVFSNKDLLYSTLALLLGLALIRYRKRIYSYIAISYDYPKFYPAKHEKQGILSPEQTAKLEKEIINFQKTLVDSEDEENLEINEDFLHECEELAESFYQETDDSGTSTDKISNSYIDKLSAEIKNEKTQEDNNKVNSTRAEEASKFEEITLDLFEEPEKEISPKASKDSSVKTEPGSESKPSDSEWKKLLDDADQQLADSILKAKSEKQAELAHSKSILEDKILPDETEEKDTTPEENIMERFKPLKKIPVVFGNGSFEKFQGANFEIVKDSPTKTQASKTDKFTDAVIDEISQYEEYCRNQSVLEDDAVLLPA